MQWYEPGNANLYDINGKYHIPAFDEDVEIIRGNVSNEIIQNLIKQCLNLELLQPIHLSLEEYNFIIEKTFNNDCEAKINYNNFLREIDETCYFIPRELYYDKRKPLVYLEGEIIKKNNKTFILKVFNFRDSEFLSFELDKKEINKLEKGDKINAIGLLSSENRRTAQLFYILKRDGDSFENTTVDDFIPEKEFKSGDKMNIRKDMDPEWGKIIRKRDKKCQCCGYSKNKHLEAHHIYSYNDHKELRNDVNNGILLCTFCHKRYHSIYGYKNCNPMTFAKYMKDYGAN